MLKVDRSDKPLGLLEKHEAHRIGDLHRAFSIFVFRCKDSIFQLLLQQRAYSKYHSGGLWTNTCCGHGEISTPIEKTARNRLKEEMGFTSDLHYAGSFHYKSQVGLEMIEHEIDHVFVAFDNPQHIYPNPEEVIEYQWIDVDFLLRSFKEKQNEFTVWFYQAFELALKYTNINNYGFKE